MPSLRLALSGYYGCGNTGDEAVLAGIVQSFRQKVGASGTHFTVFSADPGDTRRQHGVDAVGRMDWRALRRALRGCDLFLSGGGSLLQDTTSLRSLAYYLGVIRLARSAGKPVMLYAQGIGPLSRPVARALTRRVVDRADYITVRDGPSAELLRQVGVSHPPIEVTADPAFVLDPSSDQEARDALVSAGAPVDGRLIGLAVRPWRRTGPSVEEYAELVGALARRTEAHIALLPMQHPGDVELAERVAAAADRRTTVLRERLSSAGVLGVVGQMAGVVAMRLHALIFAAARGVPMVALSYDPKVRCLMAALGLPDLVVDLEAATAEDVSCRIAGAIGKGEMLRDPLRSCASHLRDLALVNVDRALGLVR